MFASPSTEEVKPVVESAIAENTVAIFSKTHCPYCTRAKALFQKEFPEITVKIFELDSIAEGSIMQSYLAEKTGQRTVPNIFINQRHIGGCDDLVSLQRKGKLAALVSAES